MKVASSLGLYEKGRGGDPDHRSAGGTLKKASYFERKDKNHAMEKNKSSHGLAYAIGSVLRWWRLHRCSDVAIDSRMMKMAI